MAPNGQKRSASVKDTPKKTARKEMSDTPSYGLEVVVVQVGEGGNQQKFIAHKDLLSHHSDFFRAALGSRWREGQDNQVELKQQAPESFKLFQHFIYSGKICSAKHDDLSNKLNAAGFPESDAEWDRLAQAWMFGEAILSTSFKDAVVDVMVHKLNDSLRYDTSLHQTIFPASTSKSKIRIFLIDVAVYLWDDSTYDALGSKDSSDFLRELAVAQHKSKGNGRHGKHPFKGDDTCHYHEHEEEGTCYKAMF